MHRKQTNKPERKPKYPEFIIRTEYYAEVFNHFQDYVYSKGYNPYYRHEQIAVVREFFFKMEEKNIGTLKDITRQDIKNHRNYLSTRQNRRLNGGLSANSIQHHVQALQNLFKWSLRNQLIEENPMNLLKFRKQITQPREALSEDIIKALYEATTTQREIALLHIFYACGLRRKEAEDLKVQDIHLEKRILIVRKGKFGKRRMIPLQQSVADDFQNYLLYERNAYLRSTSDPNEDHFLLGHSGRVLLGNQANRILKDIRERLPTELKKQIRFIYPHLLRHSIATHLKNNGMPIEKISEYLGHQSLDATQVYLYGNYTQQNTNRNKTTQSVAG